MNDLHVVSFNIPYPPDYGGAIDVFYKIKALSEAGVRIHLHCFEYDRPRSPELEEYCTRVSYYERKLFFRYFFQRKPFIVSTRKDENLILALCEDEAPILFEGLHTCMLLSHPELRDRIKLVRMHNVEWEYYKLLGKQEDNVLRKVYLYSESMKLRHFEQNLSYAHRIFAISQHDQEYLKKKFKGVRCLPAFHANEKPGIRTGTGNYALYHANLEVIENVRAALFLIKNVFNDIDFPLVIAGREPRNILSQAIRGMKNIRLVDSPSQEEMGRLVNRAQMNVLPTFQATGVKLKLLNALYQGRHCIVNKEMVTGTGLEEVCLVADSAEEMKALVLRYAQVPILQEDIERRVPVLEKRYSNRKNAKIIMDSLPSRKAAGVHVP